MWLANKGVNMPKTCAWCGEEEACDHLFVSCDSTWSNDINRVHRLLTIMWNIWFHSNLLVWKGEAHSPQHVIDIADNFLMQWLEAESLYDIAQLASH